MTSQASFTKRVNRYVAIDEQIAALRAERDALREKMIVDLGDNLEAETSKYIVRRGIQPRQQFETARLKKERPELYEEYARSTEALFFKVVAKN